MFAVAVALVFIVLWAKVLIGTRVLVGGDSLYVWLPWKGSSAAHPATNSLVLDPIREFVPWVELIQRSFASGHLPLWDPYAMSGKPLLADYQSAVFSPFTLLAAALGGTWGYSIAMLAKLWVAGLGMVVFLRLLGVRSIGVALGAISYGTCSYVVAWLAWEHSSVAVLIPWVFAAVEWQLRRPSKAGIGALALVIALQFFAGHAETSLALAEGLVIYTVCRCLDGGVVRFRSLMGLAAGAALGTAAAAVQLVPFLHEMLTTSLASYHQGAGLIHLAPSDISSWIVPNLQGNPGIDGRLGRPPHYNQTTGFAGVAALVVSMVGTVRPYRQRSVQVGLLLVALYAIGVVYGPLIPLLSRLPILDMTYNFYTIVLICFAIASLAGLGLDALADRPSRSSPRGTMALILGLAGLVGAGALTAVFLILRARVDVLPLPQAFHVRGGLGFWALLGAACLVAAAGLAIAAWNRGGRLAVSLILTLALMEAAVFAGSYEPQGQPAEAPPPSLVMSWLAAHAGSQRVAAIGKTMLPETTTLYGITDVRAYDVVRPPGTQRFWSLADPSYYDNGLFTTLFKPQAPWLAAAGVSYILTTGDQALPGTDAVYQAEGMTVGAVPDARPFVSAAANVTCVASQDAAATSLQTNGPLGPVVLETADCPQTSDAELHAVAQRPERLEITVVAQAPTVVVVLQSNTPDWVATIDGQNARILPADIQFQGVAVPAGRHTLVLEYSPQSVLIGIGISGVALVVVVFLIFSAWWPGLRRRLGSATTRPDRLAHRSTRSLNVFAEASCPYISPTDRSFPSPSSRTRSIITTGPSPARSIAIGWKSPC